MAKIRKNQRRKRFQYNKNRKSLKKKVPKVQCKTVNAHWDDKKSIVKNLKDMGLVFNVNSDIIENPSENIQAEETEVVKSLEVEANALREKGYRLPKPQIELLTYMLNKYGEDYKAMTRDKKNHAQHTWKQFKKKVNVFKSIPEQYNEFLESRKDKEVDNLRPVPVFDDDD